MTTTCNMLHVLQLTYFHIYYWTFNLYYNPPD